MPDVFGRAIRRTKGDLTHRRLIVAEMAIGGVPTSSKTQHNPTPRNGETAIFSMRKEANSSEASQRKFQSKSARASRQIALMLELNFQYLEFKPCSNFITYKALNI